MNWADFFHMGGYAFEVWTSWALTLLVLIGFVAFPKMKNARIRHDIKRQISREQLSRSQDGKQL